MLQSALIRTSLIKGFTRRTTFYLRNAKSKENPGARQVIMTDVNISGSRIKGRTFTNLQSQTIREYDLPATIYMLTFSKFQVLSFFESSFFSQIEMVETSLER